MPIATLIVDDTVTYRKILSDVLAKCPEVTVAGTAPNGVLALKKMAQSPVELVFCDVHMPEMDGVETLAHIRQQFPHVNVVMVSGISTRSADTTIKALEMGAVDFIRKPDSNDPALNEAQLTNDIKSVLRLIQLKMQTRAFSQPKPAAPRLPVSPTSASVVPPDSSARSVASLPRSIGVLAIGVSTGGPEALNHLIPALPADLGVPVLLVQHMPPLFTKSLADSLAKKSKLKVIEANENDIVVPNTVYIAPGGHHMVVRQKDGVVCIGLNEEPPENSCRPAVDVLFRSIAGVYGDKGILAAILTGMGSDGCNGVRALKRRGCFCISQSEASCVVYGMPRAIDEAHLSDKSLPLHDIAGEIDRIIKHR